MLAKGLLVLLLIVKVLLIYIPPAPVIAAPLPRHMTFELHVRTLDNQTMPMPDYLAIETECTTYGRISPTAWAGTDAPVVKLSGIWYVSILSTHDDMLYCASGVVDYAPTWIEDHDPGLPGSGDMLIIDMANVQTIELNRDKLGLWEPIAVEACGLVLGTIEQFCTELPIASEVFRWGDGGTRVWWGVNVPSWVSYWSVSWRYNGQVRP